MTVFKGYLLMMKRNLSMLFLYSFIFLSIVIIIQYSIQNDTGGVYGAVKLKIAVVDQDGGTLAKGIKKMLQEKHNVVDVHSNKSVLQEELFYGNISYVVTIPKNFEGKGVEVTRRPGDYTSVYADQQINQFLNQVKGYRTAGFDEGDAVKRTLTVSKMRTEVVLLDKNGNGGQIPGHNWMYRYLPYLYMAVLSFCMGKLIQIFKQKQIRRRMLCSSVPSNRQNLESILAYVFMGMTFWAITMLFPILLYRGGYLSDPHIGYYLLNSIALLFVSGGIAMLIGTLARNEMIISAMVNVITLGMCFTCGVFVDFSMLGAGVTKAARFLPVYWYETNNNLLGEFAALTKGMRWELYIGIGIQMGFAAALVCVALVISKSREQER